MNEIWQNAFVVAIIAIVIIIPIIIISNRSKLKRRKNMEAKLQLLALERQFDITKSELFAHKVIAVDETKKTLAFFNILDHESELVLDLNKFQAVTMDKQMHEGSVRYVLLNFKGTNGTVASIPLYESHRDSEMLLKQTIQKAELWQKKLSGLLQS